MSFVLRSMNTSDLAHVTDIEREAFPTFWPPNSLKTEKRSSTIQHLVATKKIISEAEDLTVPAIKTVYQSPIERFIRFIKRQPPPTEHVDLPLTGDPLGVLTIWFLTEEAHVTSIAVKKDWRGYGIGELLLMGGIEMATLRNSRVVTLEVRVSNHKAISLYEKYNFKRTGIRKGYYNDNREDAAIMTTDPINSIKYQQKFEELKKAYITDRGEVEMSLNLSGS